MGNKVTTNSALDVVYPMNVKQRVDHLISGYIRLNYLNKKEKTAKIWRSCYNFPIDLIKICVNYAGIDKHNDYDLIKSRTELQQEEKLIRRFVRRDGSYYSSTDCTEPYHYIPDIRIMLLGGGGVGKTALIIRLYTDKFLDEYDPTIDDSYRKSVVVDNRPVVLDIYDPSGQDEYSACTDIWMRELNLFVFVYSVTNRYTFEEIEILIERVQRVKEDIAWFGVIVGNKCDLESERQVSMEEGVNLALDHSNVKFYETSAKNKINNVEIFYECVRWYFYASDLYTKMTTDETETLKQCNCAIL